MNLKEDEGDELARARKEEKRKDFSEFGAGHVMQSGSRLGSNCAQKLMSSRYSAFRYVHNNQN